MIGFAPPCRARTAAGTSSEREDVRAGRRRAEDGDRPTAWTMVMATGRASSEGRTRSAGESGRERAACCGRASSDVPARVFINTMTHPRIPSRPNRPSDSSARRPRPPAPRVGYRESIEPAPCASCTRPDASLSWLSSLARVPYASRPVRIHAHRALDLLASPSPHPASPRQVERHIRLLASPPG